MPPRKKSDTVALKLRMKEPLRAKIERAAKNSGVSMNTEITNRLSASLEKDATNYDFFGGEANFKRMRLLGGIINEVELISKKSWVEDAHTKTKVIDLAGAFLRMFGPELPDAGSQLERGMREHEANAVLKKFVDLALDRKGPDPRKKARKVRAA